MTISPNYSGFDKYFSENQSVARKVFSQEHAQFINDFDAILTLGTKSSSPRDKRQASSVTLLLKAAKVLFVCHELGMQGHVEEAYALMRNVLELLSLSIIIESDDKVYKMWLECEELAKRHTKDGKVEIRKFKEKKYSISEILKGSKKSEQLDNIVRDRGKISDRFSHENLYNIVIRIESELGRTGLYVGDDAKDKNSRIKGLVTNTTMLSKAIRFEIEKNSKPPTSPNTSTSETAQQ